MTPTLPAIGTTGFFIDTDLAPRPTTTLSENSRLGFLAPDAQHRRANANLSAEALPGWDEFCGTTAAECSVDPSGLGEIKAGDTATAADGDNGTVTVPEGAVVSNGVYYFKDANGEWRQTTKRIKVSATRLVTSASAFGSFKTDEAEVWDIRNAALVTGIQKWRLNHAIAVDENNGWAIIFTHYMERYFSTEQEFVDDIASGKGLSQAGKNLLVKVGINAIVGAVLGAAWKGLKGEAKAVEKEIQCELKSLTGEARGYWQKQLQNGKITEAELRKQFVKEDVDELVKRLGKKRGVVPHDKAKIIESMEGTSSAAKRAADDLAKGKITQEEFDAIMLQEKQLSAAKKQSGQ